MAKTLDELTQDVTWRLTSYHPWWTTEGEPNPDRNDMTRRIMGLKTLPPNAPAWKHKQHIDSIDYFTEKLGKALDKNFGDYDSIQIAIVPSSQKGTVSKGLKDIVDKLNLSTKLIVNPGFLVRSKSVSKSHKGGVRSTEKHLSSIIVEVTPAPDIPVIVLDDVTTSGSTLRACREILQNKGVKHIIMLALGKTA